MPNPAYLGFLRQITQNAPDMPLADRQRLASMGRFAQSEGVDIGMYGDRNAAGYGAMLEDLDARQPKQEPVAAEAPRPQARQAQPFATPVQPMEMSMFSPEAQYGQLQGMAKQATNAWENELDSRVAQNREMRRMQHEKEMERLRQEGILRRLQAEQQMAMMSLRASDAARRGDNSKRFIPGRGWVPTWMT